MSLSERSLARARGLMRSRSSLSGDTEDLTRDVKSPDLACFYLMLAIQECMDLAAHVSAGAGWSPPDEVGAAFDLLAEHGVIDVELADAMRAAVGLRNRIAHGYATVDHRKLMAEAADGIDALRRYLASVASLAGL
jgi:uncharacterized protein YutE (UPF0331/DUF86 family)